MRWQCRERTLLEQLRQCRLLFPFPLFDRLGTREERPMHSWRAASQRRKDRCIGVAQCLCERDGPDVGRRFYVRATYRLRRVSQRMPQEQFRKMGIITLKVCEVGDQVYTALCPVHRELKFNEGHS